ncbi:MAG: hypothetical protein R2789_14435 [Microthrixaceae bacterium]
MSPNTSNSDGLSPGNGNQGDTVDVGIAVLEASQSQPHVHVAMTRADGTPTTPSFVDPTGTADPAEQLAEIIARPGER